jgi:DNA polymerase-3 subunit delta'
MHPDEVYDNLAKSAAAGRLAQAYLLIGRPREDGAPLAARALQALFCERGGACGRCAPCRSVAERRHPDVQWVEPQKKSRIVSIDQIRELCARMAQTSFAGSWKAGVIVGADRMSDAAANAFLKTLEEPAGRTVFFLLSDSPQGLLPTILSRCQRAVLTGMETGLTGEFRQALVEILSRHAGQGVVGALALAEKLEALLKLMKEAAEEEVGGAREAENEEVDDDVVDARINARYREWRMLLMRSVLLWYRDVLLLAGGAGDSALHFSECGEALERSAKGVSYAGALRRVEAAAEMYRRMERNVPDGTVLSAGFMEMAQG